MPGYEPNVRGDVMTMEHPIQASVASDIMEKVRRRRRRRRI